MEKSEHLPLVLSVHVFYLFCSGSDCTPYIVSCILYTVHILYIVYLDKWKTINLSFVLDNRPKYSILAARGLRYNKLYKQYIQYSIKTERVVKKTWKGRPCGDSSGHKRQKWFVKLYLMFVEVLHPWYKLICNNLQSSRHQGLYWVKCAWAVSMMWMMQWKRWEWCKWRAEDDA